MINNNIYALLIGVGDYKKIKISDLPSYRMDVALIGTGLISGLKCMQEHIRFMAGEDNNGFVSISSLAKGVDSFKRALSTEDTFIFFFFPVMEVLKIWYLAMVRSISKVL